MTVLNLADDLKIGTSQVDAVYLGDDLIWPTVSPWSGAVTLLDSATSVNAATVASASFTPPANSLLFVQHSHSAWSHSTAPDVQIANTGGLTFTRYVTAVQDFAGPNDIQGALFVAPVGASPSSMTVTVDPYTTADQAYQSMVVYAVTEAEIAQAPVGRIVESGSTTHTTASLGAATTDGNLVIAGFSTHSTGATAASAPSGFTPLVAQNVNFQMQSVFYSTDFAGTAVTNPDLGESIYVTASWVLEIRAPVVVPDDAVMPWHNHVLYACPRNGTTTRTVTASGTGGTLVSGTAFTPTVGRELIAVVAGPVTSTRPSGWALVEQIIGSSGLYVWQRTVDGTSADGIATTHNASNYPVAIEFFELPAETTVVAAESTTGIPTSDVGPTLTGLTGFPLVLAAKAVTDATSGSPPDYGWSVGTKLGSKNEDLAATIGYGYMSAFQESVPDGSYKPYMSMTNMYGDAEAMAVAFDLPAYTPKFVGSSFTTYASRTNTTIMKPAGVIDGDYLVHVLLNGGATPPTPTAPGSFSPVVTPSTVGSAGFNVTTRIYAKFASSEGSSWTYTHSSSPSQGYCLAYRGVNVTTPLDVAVVFDPGVGGTFEHLGLTTVTDDARIVLAGHDWGSQSGFLYPPEGDTPRFSTRIWSAPLISVQDGVMSVAGATGTKSWDNNSAVGEPYSTFMLALRSATAPFVYEPPEFVAATTTTYASRTNTTIPAPDDIEDDDVILLGILTGAAEAPDPTAPDGFAAFPGASTDVTYAGFNVEMRVYYKAASSESGDYTFTHTTASSQGFALAYRGVDTTTPFDVTATSATGTGATSTAPGLTTVTPNAMLVWLGHDWGGTPSDLTPPTGFDERFEVNPLIYGADAAQAVVGASGDKSMTSTNGFGNPWAAILLALRPVGIEPTVTEVLNESFTTVADGTNDFLPRTGWVSADEDDGGTTYAGAWETFKDGSTSVLYIVDSSAALTYDVGAEGMEVETSVKLYTPSTDMVTGVVAALSSSDQLNYVACVLSLTGSTNHVVVYYRDGGSYDLFYNEEADPPLVANTDFYNLRLRYFGGVVTVWLDDVLIGTPHTLSGPQQAALAGHTRGGLINASGFQNWDYVKLSSVTS